MSHPSQDSADLAVLAFPQNDFHFGRLGTRLQYPSAFDFHKPFGDVDAFAHLLHCQRFDLASHRHPVDLSHAILWVCQQLCQVAVVGQQDQAFAAAVQSTDWEDAFGSRHKIDHAWAPMRIGIRRDDAFGFVNRVVDLLLSTEVDTVNAYLLRFRID